MHARLRLRRIGLCLLCLLVAGCALKTGVRRQVLDPEDLDRRDREAEVLKAHMRDGRVAVLETWKVDSTSQTVSGTGWWFDADRDLLEEGPITVTVDSVALFETNAQHMTDGATGFLGLTVLSGIVTVACLTNPKACFGSCPTFYLQDEAQQWKLVAEGFSASVAPSLEATDVDALGAREVGATLDLRLTNEAYETHSIRHADLLSVEVDEGERVGRASGGRFRRLHSLDPPRRAWDEKADCLQTLARRDGIERLSLASETDMAEREFVEVVFDLPPQKRECELGLLVSHRQSLMSTWLFYQGLSYLGSQAGAWLAELERGSIHVKEKTDAIGQRLGGIEVQRQDEDGSWSTVAELHETGPLAVDTDLVELGPASGDRLHLRLRLTRGLWRLDALELAVLGEEVEPTRHRPQRVLRRHREDWSDDPVHREALLDPQRTLVTLPSDELRLEYDFDGGGRRELFLESRGWYLEWMREQWLEEEDPWMAAQLFLAPEQALRQLAPQYKRVEAEMELVFWGSRYATP